jgi:hypothetical protein
MSKTHYRKVFKSDHLGVADLEDLIEAGSKLVFTIRQVKQELDVRVAGRKGNYNIAYFNEKIKPLVLNAGNSKIVKSFAGGSSFVEDWGNITIQLYINPSVELKGEITGGVRINPAPVQKRSELMPNTTAWTNAVAAFKRDGNLDKVIERMDVSPANQKLIAEQSNVS